MPRALFLDQSTTACGFSLAAFSDAWQFLDIEVSGVMFPPKEKIVARVDWLMEQGATLIETYKPAEVVMEDTRFSGGRTHGNRATDEAMGALSFGIMIVCNRLGIPVYRQNPGTIKLNGAGHGAATKGQMIIAASVLLGREPRDDNEADAVLAAFSWAKERPNTLYKLANPTKKKKVSRLVAKR